MSETKTKLDPRIVTLCGLCVERMAVLGEKGKKADDGALHFFIGAASAATLAGDDKLSGLIQVFAMYGVAFRGMMEVRMHANG
jgi:hypothetical protein